nr:CpsB/CapC family capsule biosynthesis tyrosine phosphatase [Ktedonobacteraceae bacterium]
MIDTHLHILPGVDDGPETMEEAVALASVLVQEGVHAAIATPHYNDQFCQRSAAEVKERVNELQQVLDRQGILLRLFAGHEALIKPGLVDDILAGKLATLNGSRYLLLELWNSNWLPATEQVIFELRASGITPVLAHPERYRVFQKELNLLESLQQQGVLVQITASSLLGMQGRTAQRTAEKLLKRGLVHFIASDAHGLYSRPPAIAQSLCQIAKLIGQVKMLQFTESWPMMIINNVPYGA